MKNKFIDTLKELQNTICHFSSLHANTRWYTTLAGNTLSPLVEAKFTWEGFEDGSSESVGLWWQRSSRSNLCLLF